MKKKIVIDSKEEAEVKKVERNIYKDNYHKLVSNPIIEWLIYMVGYAVVLLTVSALFKSFEINTSHLGIYALLASIIMGSTETTLYTIAVYTSSVKIKNSRGVLIAALLADFTGIMVSLIVCRWMFG